MKVKSNIDLTVWEIIWNNGKTEYMVMNSQQLAGFKRRKGIKKQFISLKKMVNVSLQIKSAI